MTTLGSLKTVTATNQNYAGDGTYTIVNYALPEWQYNIKVTSPNTITITNNNNKAVDTLTNISEIDFADNTVLDIYLTPLVTNFTYNANNWANIYAGSSSQTITLNNDANVDIYYGLPTSTYTIINNSSPNARVSFGGGQATTVDLQTGKAISPQGSSVNLQNFNHVGLNGNNGDQAYGTAGNDSFDLNFNQKGGSGLIDGRGGSNTINLWDMSISDLVVTNVAADASSVMISYNGYTYNLKNIQIFQFNYPDGSQNTSLYVTNLIDFSKLGEQTLLSSTRAGWNSTNPGQTLTLNYSFLQAVPAAGEGSQGTGFIKPSAAYQAAVQSVLSQLSTQIGVSFNLVDGATNGTLQFGVNNQASSLGYAFGPGSGATAGQIWLDVNALNSLQPGQQGYQTLLSCIGTSLGLSAPVANTVANGATKLLSQWNNNDYTVMSPNQSFNGLWQTWFAPLDIQALQALYGTSANAPIAPTQGQTFSMSDANGQVIATLPTTNGGFNILDCSNVSRGVYINLSPNTYSSVGVDLNGVSAISNLFIGNKTLIQEVMGSNADDYLIGNTLNDVFIPQNGNDIIVGGSGLNTAVLNQAYATYSVYQDAGSGNWIVSDLKQVSGYKQLKNIERLQFKDINVALDLDVSNSGGKAAEMLGAAFGLAGLKNPKFAGIALSLFDSGRSLQDVAALAVSSGLISSPDNTSFVKTIWLNVIGSSIDDSNLNNFVGLLNHGSMTQASLLAAAATSPQNLTAINLVGLAQTGLQYS